MLVDSYALQAAVLESGLTDQMMQRLTDIGVTGVAMLAGALRKPVAVEAAARRPADWQGVTFGTYRSEAEFEAIRALDASPKVGARRRPRPGAAGRLHRRLRVQPARLPAQRRSTRRRRT